MSDFTERFPAAMAGASKVFSLAFIGAFAGLTIWGGIQADNWLQGVL
jgi:hypothetical protein